jgi:hypothetical protein
MPRIHPISRLLKDMVAAARQLHIDLVNRRRDPAISAARESLSADLGRDVPVEEAADVLAQAVVCALPILAVCETQIPLDWLNGSLSGWEQWVLKNGAHSSVCTHFSVLRTQYSEQIAGNGNDSPHLYEQFLHRYAPKTRRHHGVFFTPQPLADFIVRRIDAMLRDDFALPAGLASHSALRNPHSALRFLDPACGTGVFLLAVIDVLHARLRDDWPCFVPHLLPRLTGIELLPVPAFLAKLNIALKLAETGYAFKQPGQIDIRLGDALSPDSQFAICNSQFAIPVILGNPPFSSLTTNTNPWIASLVRGGGEIRGYVQAGDERLRERKTWLHDDYVKFIRLAQWIVEEADAGLVGFVTNHGYLDNATFRLMRRELLRVFPHIEIVDLHGNRKKGETAPRGGNDENIFGLDQGIAIGLFAKPTRRASEGKLTRSVSEEKLTRSASEGEERSDGASRVEYADLWGTRAHKLASLDAAPSLARRVGLPSLARPVRVTAPSWRFIPATSHVHPEYAAGWLLTEVMPVNTTAPVTARDDFVVAFTREELEQRIAEFRDLSIPDEVIRAKYFSRTRSRRYERGDTRSWKLGQARRCVAADSDWPDKIIRCLYRPLDWRYIFWHAAMIDWPRNEVTRHLIALRNPQSAFRNLCLIARRQQLPTQPCTYFWVSDCVALDGVIRSDNRGSESLFPLYLAADDGRANFDPVFLAEVAKRMGGSIQPAHLFAYIYALFHSPTYRERYAADLRADFPRVQLPASGELLLELAALGHRLIEAHLLRDAEGVGSLWPKKSVHHGKPLPAKDSRPPCGSVASDFRVGGYPVLKKWLQPKHRRADDPKFACIAESIEQTIQLMAEIDALIEQHGGFPTAFAQRGRESLAEKVRP